jgi:DNA primase
MAGLIPQPFIDELLQRTDIVELIDGYVPLKKQGTSYKARCPFHSEKTPSFNVVAEKQFYHCFGCGVSGNAISFLMEYLHQPFVDAIDTLASRLGLEIPRSDSENAQIKQSQNYYQLLEKVNLYYQKQLRDNGALAIDYLKKRGLDGKTAKKYQLGLSQNGWHHLEQAFKYEKKALLATGMLISRDDKKVYDRFRNRIMFPIHDKRGRIIAFGGRVISNDDTPKYLNSPETMLFQKNRELYGLHIALQSDCNDVIIVEGYMDVVALAQQGITNAVATLGTATSTTHIQLLSRHYKRITFCFDGDAAGKQAAIRAMTQSIGQINHGLDLRFVFLPQGHDPDSLVRQLGRVEFSKLIERAIPFNTFFFEHMLKEINIDSMAGKSQLIEKIKPHFNQIPDEIYKHLLLEQLTRITHLDGDRLYQLLSDKEITQKTPEKALPSANRLTIALLLQHPTIYAEIKPHLKQELLKICAHDALIRLIDVIDSHENINTGSVIENFRNTTYFDAFNKLAGKVHHIPENGIFDELLGALKQIERQGIDELIKRLINKAQTKGLSDEERMKLQDLIKSAKQSNI